jgi:hypothetical protein
MKEKDVLDEKTKSVVSDYLLGNEIRSISIKKGVGITKNSEISDVDIIFITDKNDQSQDYSIKFKLQTECSDICRYIKSIVTTPNFAIEPAEYREKIQIEQFNMKILSLIEIIRERVKSAQKEQKVQNISYVGNTFVLNNSIKFKVLSDDGDGRLNIKVLTKDLPMDALLTASGLLDGLYIGSIKLAES